MQNKHIIWIFVLGFMMNSMSIEARTGRDRVIWAGKANSNTGLYTTQNYFVSQGVSFNGSAMYYFGDADNEGVAFNGGFNLKNMSLGGGLRISYNMPAGNCCNMRYALMGGTLRGNNKDMFDNLPTPRDDYRSFHSWFVQPSVGVEYYPFTRAGFYIYGGIALTISIIDQFQYYHHITVQNETQYISLEGHTYGILPMVQLGLGYSWRLSESVVLSLELMGQEGLVDAHYMNLDAYPMASGQNKYGIEMGSVGGKWVDANGKEHLHWNDGWFQLGLTLAYKWRECEYCRNTQVYGATKVRRRR